MAWELRNGKQYYYRKIRKGRRVISEYVGAGEFAELLFQLDEIDRVENTMADMAWKIGKEDDKKLNRDVNQLAKVINNMARVSLLFSGYYCHKGQWRRIRNG